MMDLTLRLGTHTWMHSEWLTMLVNAKEVSRDKLIVKMVVLLEEDGLPRVVGYAVADNRREAMRSFTKTIGLDRIVANAECCASCQIWIERRGEDEMYWCNVEELLNDPVAVEAFSLAKQ